MIDSYEPLLPKMNQIMINSQNYELLESVKSILLTACSESVFAFNSVQKRTQKCSLGDLGFLSLLDPTLGTITANVTLNAKLASRLLGAITDQQ